jgi:type II secretory pathway pseudopilin PulG
MKFRKLRIAWSVFWGLACVLLIVLWVRSYWFEDLIFRGEQLPRFTGTKIDLIDSESGTIWIWRLRTDICTPNWWQYITDGKWTHRTQEAKSHPESFEWSYDGSEVIIRFPDYLPVIVLGFLAVAPVVRWRFSLRTLLVSTTLIAVVLALVAGRYANEKQKLENSESLAATIVNALREYKLANGHYPSELNELVPKYLPRIEPPTWGNPDWDYRRVDSVDADDTFSLLFKTSNTNEHGYDSENDEWH